MWGGYKCYYVMDVTIQALYATPIQKLGTLGSNDLFIKRDDLFPYSFGGNKARKAALFFQKIDKGEFDTVVTYGSSHSNHCRVVANMAAARGLKCLIICPEEVSEMTFNKQMMQLFDASFITVPVSQVHETINSKLYDLEKNGHKPYFIPGGGHGNIGTQAYVQCYEEIREDHFDYIFHASGTGTTQAGLICGKLRHGDDVKVVGISIARKNPYGRQVVMESVREYLDEVDGADSETVFVDDYIGNGYGKDDPEIQNTIRDVLVNHGIPLDTTYTGKAFYGMKKYIEKNGIADRKILFIHTGGTPLFFDDVKKWSDKNERFDT